MDGSLAASRRTQRKNSPSPLIRFDDIQKQMYNLLSIYKKVAAK